MLKAKGAKPRLFFGQDAEGERSDVFPKPVRSNRAGVMSDPSSPPLLFDTFPILIRDGCSFVYMAGIKYSDELLKSQVSSLHQCAISQSSCQR